MLKTYLNSFFLLASLALGFASSSAQAAFSPLGVSLFPPVQFPPEDFTITGARFNVYGEHHSVYGFDLGLANVTRQSMVGVQVGVLNVNKGTTTGVFLQAGGIGNFNTNKADIYGLQIAVGINSNRAESVLVGLGVAAVNYTPFTKVIGAQLGIYNKANQVYGLQIGLVNSAENLHGIQIGLLNFNARGLFSVAPILNAGF